MILFQNGYKKPSGAAMRWILEHPEYVICKVQAERLNNRELQLTCNLHPGSCAIVAIEIVEKKVAYRIVEICCYSFRQDAEQALNKIKMER